MFARSFALVVAAVLSTGGRSSQLPAYDARQLRPIAWRADSPRPEDHAGDYTYAVAVLRGRPVGILRGAVGWGTGGIEESFTLVRHHHGWTLDSLRNRLVARDQIWDALSFYKEAADAATGDRARGHFSVAGCLFVADDSLIGYGVFPDTSANARRYITEQKGAERAGYYRLTADGRRLVRVAALTPMFETRCRERLEVEGRGLSDS